MEKKIRFNSYGDFLKAANGETDMKTGRASRDNDDSWAGSSFDDALKMAKYGWDEGAKKAREFSGKLIKTIGKRIIKKDITRSVEGFAVDIGRFCEGVPECFIDWENSIVPGEGNRIIRLLVNATFSGSVSTEIIIRRGAILGALVELLELGGHAVQVEVCSALSKNNHYSKMVMPIKDAGHALNLPMVMFAIAHPSMLRRILFSYWETWDKETRENFGIQSGWGYGAPDNYRDHEKISDIYIPRMYGDEDQWKTAESAEDWILKMLKENGIELKKEKAIA